MLLDPEVQQVEEDGMHKSNYINVKETMWVPTQGRLEGRFVVAIPSLAMEDQKYTKKTNVTYLNKNIFMNLLYKKL